MTLKRLLAPLGIALLAACTPQENATQTATAPISINAPSGTYQLDPTHATLQFSVKHLGLSNYIVGFTDYSVTVDLDTENLQASSVAVSINPTSIRTDYTGDYKATHPKSSFDTWEQDLAMSDKFLNAAQYPEITFESTTVRENPVGKLEIQGELTLLGQTHPVTLHGEIVGSTEQHPFTKRGAIGFSLTGSFKRSQFGMDHLVKPGFVGDEVTVNFEGELHQRN